MRCWPTDALRMIAAGEERGRLENLLSTLQVGLPESLEEGSWFR